MATFQKDPLGWNHVLRNPKGLVGSHMHTVGRQVVRLAKAQVGVKSGDLRRSIGYTVRVAPGGFLTKVTASDKKALMHHMGTKPHIIRPKKAQALRFRHHGRIVYARIVHHPGTKANRFLTDPMRTVVQGN